ncbi:MAG: hypothetical protein JNG84_07680, partial [Archangium sp.]|nr:hypothetical protein [Archangium sp.]
MKHTLRWTVVSGLVAMALVRCADFRAAAVEFCDVNPTALGCSGEVLDAGGTDAGPVDSGVIDAGPAVYDGGAPCSAGGRPRLRCAAPIAMTQVGGMGRSALAATDDSFIAIFIRPNTNEVELYQRFLDGGSTSHTYAN